AADNIKFVAMNYDDTMQEDTEKLVKAFNDSQGDVKADVQVVSWNDGYQTLVTMISGNKAPALATVSASCMIEFNGTHAVEPLHDKSPRGSLAPFARTALDAMGIGAKLRGLPYFLDPRAFYYRTDLFEAAGLQPPTTWDELRAAAKALHNPPDVYGI